jgi:hypothetical protein
VAIQVRETEDADELIAEAVELQDQATAMEQATKVPPNERGRRIPADLLVARATGPIRDGFPSVLHSHSDVQRTPKRPCPKSADQFVSFRVFQKHRQRASSRIAKCGFVEPTRDANIFWNASGGGLSVSSYFGDIAHSPLITGDPRSVQCGAARNARAFRSVRQDIRELPARETRPARDGRQ